MPLKGAAWVNPLSVEGDNRPFLERPMANDRFVSPDYFRAAGISVVAGRAFAESDRGRPVAILSKNAAEKLWPGLNPIGRKLWTNGTDVPIMEVVGVVADARVIDLEHAPMMMAYVPYWQQSRPRTALLMRSAVDPESLAAAMRAATREVDADVPVPVIQSMQGVVDESLGRRRFQMTLAMGFAVLAMLLASLGVYGVVAYWVQRRRAELGIRLALGARRGQISAMVLRQGMAPVVAGLSAGLLAALAGGRLVESLLFGVKASEPLVFAMVAGLLTLLAMLACAIPAFRASRLEAMAALRYE